MNNNLGTWIDWQYLLDAAALLAKVCASLSKQSIGCNDLVQRAPYSIYHKSVTKKGFKWISCVIGDRMLRKSKPHDAHSKKRASCNKSVDILQQTSYQQADITMRSHGLRQLVDDKSVESCQQSCCKLIVKTCYQQACLKLFQQVVKSLQITSCNKPCFKDLLKLDKTDKIVATS